MLSELRVAHHAERLIEGFYPVVDYLKKHITNAVVLYLPCPKVSDDPAINIQIVFLQSFCRQFGIRVEKVSFLQLEVDLLRLDSSGQVFCCVDTNNISSKLRI